MVHLIWHWQRALSPPLYCPLNCQLQAELLIRLQLARRLKQEQELVQDLAKNYQQFILFRKVSMIIIIHLCLWKHFRPNVRLKVLS